MWFTLSKIYLLKRYLDNCEGKNVDIISIFLPETKNNDFYQTVVHNNANAIDKISDLR